MPQCPIAGDANDEGIFFFKFLFHDIPCNITQQLMKNKATDGIARMRTKVKYTA